ncbi:zinc-ribbon domain-containing protein [Agathobaculum sp. Marseille-P7918]
MLAQWGVSCNASLTPDSISYDSKQKVWWRCTEGMCGRLL